MTPDVWLEHLLQAVGFHWTLARPMLPTYLHLVLSAVIPIYTGAHASLTRPSSAARPAKNDSDEVSSEGRMESLDLVDALLMPILAAVTLATLYILIQWLDDPAILTKLLNAYFAVFGVVALAKLLADALSILQDFVFPSSWTSWAGQTHVASHSGRIQTLLGKRARLQAFVQRVLYADIRIGVLTVIAFSVAVGIQIFSNIWQPPWYINNLSAYAFVYSALQLMSPSTAATATLLLCALFCYDIYFVFYTPMMLEVATKLDIPAKMVFPRPEGLSMLGLGDLVLPGIVIGFALRFDLWLHYHRKGSSVTYLPATGQWGTRFWTSRSYLRDKSGTLFAKPYFTATMVGYVAGLLVTLVVMQVWAHAQPALLYLVPGVLGALWLTAALRGELTLLWQYDEAPADDGVVKADEKNKESRGWWRQLFDSAPEDADKDGLTKYSQGHLVWLTIDYPQPASPANAEKADLVKA